MLNIIVGGAGFIGSHLVNSLSLQGENVIVIDDLTSGSLENLKQALKKKNLRFLQANITDLPRIRKRLKKGSKAILFNLATLGLIKSLSEPEKCFEREVAICASVVKLVREGFANQLVHFSTSEVYGNVKMPVIDPEKSWYRPTTAYAAAKLASDNFIRVMVDSGKLDALIIRPFNNYGSGQYFLDYQGIIPKTIRLFLSGKRAQIYGDGSQTRDFIYVEDTISRLMQIVKHHFSMPIKKRKHLIYQVCAEREISILDLVKLISRCLGRIARVDFFRARQGEIMRLCGKQTPIHTKFKEPQKMEDIIKKMAERQALQCKK